MIRFNTQLAVSKTQYGHLGRDEIRTEWHVIHPSNGAILATCDTEPEAQAVVGLFAGIVQLVEDNQAPGKDFLL